MFLEKRAELRAAHQQHSNAEHAEHRKSVLQRDDISRRHSLPVGRDFVRRYEVSAALPAPGQSKLGSSSSTLPPPPPPLSAHRRCSLPSEALRNQRPVKHVHQQQHGIYHNSFHNHDHCGAMLRHPKQIREEDDGDLFAEVFTCLNDAFRTRRAYSVAFVSSLGRV